MPKNVKNKKATNKKSTSKSINNTKKSNTTKKKTVHKDIDNKIKVIDMYDTGIIDLPKKKVDKLVNKELDNILKEHEIKENQIKTEKKKKISVFFILFLCIIYMELLFHILVFGITNLFGIKTIYYTLFAIITSLLLGLITCIGKNKVNKIITGVLVFILGIYYFGSYMFKSLFNTFFSFHLLGISDQAATFIGDALIEVLKRIPMLILFLLPFLFIMKYKNKLLFKMNIKKMIYIIFVLVSCIGLFYCLVNLNNENKKLFYNIDNNAMNIEKLGLNVSTYLDLKRIFVPVEEEILNDNLEEDLTEEEIEYGPNMIDIDFDSLIANTSNKTVKSMHEYFQNQNPTYKNEYTGIYEGKNLVVVMGESLNSIAISEKYTPTLYKLSHEGFEFTNFYTPINMSTLGGEFQGQTGLFANLSMLTNKFRTGSNYYPYGLGKVYNDLDYDVSAYHANTGTFQSRDKYLKSLGYTNYLYKGNGLEKLMNCNTWPQSDYDMVNVTIDEILTHDKFMAYYVSVSGHMPWTFGGNDMAKRNKELVQDMNVSEEAKGYVAANIELDKALELLIKKLEESGKLDDTVIAVIPDHYPYSMNIDAINELSDYKRDEKFEVNHSTLILWNNNQEHVKIDKITNQLDVLPTILNLFNIKYDSRLIIGKDIFAPSEGLVYFTDRSWISDKGRYNAATRKFTSSTDEEVAEDYINKINNIVSSRINMSKLIMEHDYYRIVLGE